MLARVNRFQPSVKWKERALSTTDLDNLGSRDLTNDAKHGIVNKLVNLRGLSSLPEHEMMWFERLQV